MTACHWRRSESTSQSISSLTLVSMRWGASATTSCSNSLLDAALVEQVEDAHQAQGAVEVILAALLHLEQDVLDIGHAEGEIALHVLSVHRQLRLHVLQGMPGRS